MTTRNKISVVQVEGLDHNIDINKLGLYPELPMAVEYLILKDSGLTMDGILDILRGKYKDVPTTRQGLYVRVDSWRKNQTLREAELEYMAPKIEEMRASVQYVINGYTQGLRLMADDVQDAKISLKTRTEAMQFLKDAVVDPRFSQEEEPGTLEKQYAQKKRNFSPVDVED